MDLDQSDFEKIIEFLSLENFFVDKNFSPKSIGDGQSNPTFLIRDNENNFKEVKSFCDSVLSLPMFPDITEEEVKYVCEKVNEVIT